MSPVELKDRIKIFVAEISLTDLSKLKNETLIFQEGYFDSMGFVSLISFLENEFSIETEDKDLIEENFESINAIATYIIHKNDQKN